MTFVCSGVHIKRCILIRTLVLVAIADTSLYEKGSRNPSDVYGYRGYLFDSSLKHQNPGAICHGYLLIGHVTSHDQLAPHPIENDFRFPIFNLQPWVPSSEL